MPFHRLFPCSSLRSIKNLLFSAHKHSGRDPFSALNIHITTLKYLKPSLDVIPFSSSGARFLSEDLQVPRRTFTFGTLTGRVAQLKEKERELVSTNSRAHLYLFAFVYRSTAKVNGSRAIKRLVYLSKGLDEVAVCTPH